jgi:predicted RNA-binding Zn-ribbon protein involved in translation (DUF1610 family)
MTNCPTCSSARIYPSRLRSAIERVRRALTEHQPYRCHACGFRGWGQILVPVDEGERDAEELRSGGITPPITSRDLDQLDRPD